MAGSDSILMRHIAPGLGTLVAWTLYGSPLKAVLLVRQQKALGSLNPLPLVAMWANCTAWLIYSFLKADVYVLVSNIPGLLLAGFMTFSCYGFAEERVRDTMLLGVLAFASLLAATGGFISFARLEPAAAANIWGSTTVTILLIFYSAPLSVLAEVLRTRSSASLYLPFAIANAANGALWTAYGAAVPDAFIWAPNAVGALFGALQVVLCLVFPSKPGDRYRGQASPLPLDSEEAGLSSGSALHFNSSSRDAL